MEKVSKTTRLDARLVDMVDQLASRKGWTFSQAANEALTAWIIKNPAVPDLESEVGSPPRRLNAPQRTPE